MFLTLVFCFLIQVAAQAKKPNILLILADDVGTGDVPSYWNSSVVEMPNLDRLAKMGVTFKDVHSTPLCAPSRYMLLSGNYAHRGSRPNGSWGLWENGNQFLTHQKSIAEVLRDGAGYRTSMVGKWHLGAKAPPSGTQGNQDFERLLTSPEYDWSLPLMQGPQDIGFDRSYVTTGGIQDPPYSFFRDGYLTSNATDITYWNIGSYPMPHGKSAIGKNPGEGDRNWDSTAYNMILVNETTKFIDNHLENEPDKPFFAYVAMGAAHIPHSPPTFYLDGSRVEKEYETRHLDMLLEMDKVVGSLVSMIEDKQLTEDTIIIFTSDNGGLNNSAFTGHLTSGPLRGKKGNIYEGGHRVPLIMRYDNMFPTNERRTEMIGLNDIYATICELVGIDVTAGSAQDSVSFAKYIESGENKNGLRKNLGTWTYGSATGTRREEAIRHGSLKLIHYFQNSTFELYNLATDLSESVDLIKDEKYAKKLRIMKRRLEAIGPCPGRDLVGKFMLERTKRYKSCSWFKTNTKRCRRYIEGELYCASVCGRNKEWCTG